MASPLKKETILSLAGRYPSNSKLNKALSCSDLDALAISLEGLELDNALKLYICFPAFEERRTM